MHFEAVDVLKVAALAGLRLAICFFDLITVIMVALALR